jgi:hypothetical protein
MAMILISLPARLLLVVTALAISVCAQVPHGQDDEAEEKGRAQELRLQQNDSAWTVRIKQQFDQSVFGNGGWEPGARRELELRLAKHVAQFERPCELTEPQTKKLFAAGRGDIKRFFDHVEEARRRIPEVRGGVVLPLFNMVQQEAEPLKKEREGILAGEGFFFKQAVRHTLTEEQLGRSRKDLEDRRRFRYRASVRWTVVMLARSLGLTDDQRRRFEALLLEETRPPKEFGVADCQIVMYQAAQIPEARIKPIFDDLQWRTLRQEFAVARDQLPWLKNREFLPFEKIGD